MDARIVRALLATTALRAAVPAALAVTAPALPAQLVPIRTVPVASGDQYLFLPSYRLGMGGVRGALPDTLAAGWGNPAEGAFLQTSEILSAPTFYGISSNGGGGRTFPLAGRFTGASVFGGVSVALQQIDNRQGPVGFFVEPAVDDVWIPRGPGDLLRDASARNLYAAGYLGWRLGNGWSLGLGAAGAALNAMDGVDLLYANALGIEQSGTLSDIRVGVHHDGERDDVGLILLHNRVSMEHDVAYQDWFWVDSLGFGRWSTRVEHNEDRTRTWGAHGTWQRELDAPGWRVGASATVNRKDHPKIPNYEIQNIPRDPGETWAWDVTLGLARRGDETLFGVDLAFQPIWSDTWQEAGDTVLPTLRGRSLSGTDRTIENDFFFTNVVMRAGFSWDPDALGLQVGVEVRSYDYDFDQVDHVAGRARSQHEAWMEWTPSIGASYRFDAAELRYAGRVTTGTGRPGVATRFAGEGDMVAAPGSDFIVAPQAPLTLQDAQVVTHQVSVRIPIR